MKDHPAVIKYARSFAATSGAELDDMLQVARIALQKAERAVETGKYDPRKASFNTYATWAVYRGMCSAVARRERTIPEGWDPTVRTGREDNGRASTADEMADEVTPAPDRRLLLAELIRELPSDARAVVDLVLGDTAGDLVDLALDGHPGAIDRLRSHIRRALGLRRGDRAEAAFGAITEMLAEVS
jgi:DNA-directed RNA polymerase specialized sigma24 family protein